MPPVQLFVFSDVPPSLTNVTVGSIDEVSTAAPDAFVYCQTIGTELPALLVFGGA